MHLFVRISLLAFIYVFILSFCNSCLSSVFSLFPVHFVTPSSIPSFNINLFLYFFVVFLSFFFTFSMFPPFSFCLFWLPFL